MWEKGLLGDSNPQILLDTMVYYLGYYFPLRSGLEQQRLRHYPSQLTLVENPGSHPYLHYKEDVSKNHQGGLKNKPKEIIQYANTDNPDRCIVRLHKLCSPDQPNDAFNLQPVCNPVTGITLDL